MQDKKKYEYWAVKAIILCIVVFILQQLIYPDFTNFFLLSQDHPLQIWRYLTAIFLHGSLGHLVLNMFALGIFGSMLEKFIGRRFILVFLVSGIIANVISINFYASSLGASGAIFGIIGALVIIRPTMAVWAFGLPMPMFLAAMLWAALDIIGYFNPSEIANVAHLSGLAVGLIFGVLYRDWSSNQQRETRVIIDEDSMRRWEEQHLR
jgi:membrane associated rhomboid family serine protease